MMKIKSLLIFTLFISVLAFAQTPIHHFTFNNTYSNSNSTIQLGQLNATFPTSFVTGRNGGQAVNIPNAGGLKAIINNLPLGNNPRTVATWIKFNQYNATGGSYIFSYGNAVNGQAFGLTMNYNNGLEQYNWGAGYSVTITINENSNVFFNNGQWYHLVTTYDGSKIKIYMNGALIKTQNLAINTSNTINNLFKIGATPSTSSWLTLNATIDDLQIFDVALTDAQVNSLYSGTLATADLSNIKNNISIYPNPAKDVVFVKSETLITKIELYDFSGKKIKESASKEMNISSLQRGNYLVKITDKEGNTQTKSLIKE
ncbi:LamG-like jellyroll fold domain-containing protein [Cloacibacterium caeni]|uniref:LamG-like jellyroll fold domain-containing protein n=1 Tax=Cloacibacterium caeni TaxID=2004710 RepID=UPI001BD00B2D|nr:LamG-like jellyroll fold domain-containing protein [Cloacibacterium caeni]